MGPLGWPFLASPYLVKTNGQRTPLSSHRGRSPQARQQFPAPHPASPWVFQVAPVVKSPSAVDTRHADLIPGSGRSPGAGNGNPLQYSCPGNPVDRATWGRTYSPCGHKESDTTEHTHGRPSPLITVSLFTMCVSLFLCCKYVHLYHTLDSTCK